MANKIGQTKKITTSAAISAVGKSAIVRAITLQSGTTDSSIIIKDGATGGTEKWKLSLNGTTGVGETVASISFGGNTNNQNGGIICSVDAFGTIAGTNAVAWVLFDEIES